MAGPVPIAGLNEMLKFAVSTSHGYTFRIGRRTPLALRFNWRDECRAASSILY